MQKTLAIAACLAVASTALAQMPMPAFNSTFTSSLTRGFYFQCPTSAVIQGLEVCNEAVQPNQVVEVIDFGTTMPTAYPTTVTGAQLFYDNTSPSGTVIPCSIPLIPGNWYGILGACNDTQGSATSYNSYGAAGPFMSDILGNPVQVARLLTQSGIASNGGNQPCSTEDTANIGRVEVYIGTGTGNFAQKLPFGTGCYASNDGAFYETFPSGTFDLSNTSFQMLYTGASYLVLPGSNSWFTPLSANLGLGDDAVSAAQPLGFTLPFVGGSTPDVWVSSNGFVYLETSTASGCCSGSAATLLSGEARVAAIWGDLNPSSTGSVHFDQDLANGAAYVTFLGVPEYGQTNTNDFQIAFFDSGIIEVRYLNCANASHTVLAGFSPGNGTNDPGAMDLSTIPTMPHQTGTHQIPLALAADARPVLGTSFNLVTSSIPMTALLGGQILGFAGIPGGIDLTAIGMPGCYQYASMDQVAVVFPTGSTSTFPFALPNAAVLAGLHVFAQSAALDPAGGYNALGALTSNGVELILDVN